MGKWFWLVFLLIVLSQTSDAGFGKIGKGITKSIKKVYKEVKKLKEKQCSTSNWCVHRGATTSWVDCDRDGFPDAVCTDTGGRFGYISSASKCTKRVWNQQGIVCNSWKGQVCQRPAGWCGHGGATFAYKDCDIDGIPDPICRDTQGNFGVIKSSQKCLSVWPRALCVGDEVRKWAPQVRFHKNENFMPSSVDFFLKQVTIKCTNGQRCSAPSYLTSYNVPKCSDKCYFNTKQRLRSPSSSDLAVFKGEGTSAPVYAIVNEHSGNIMDIYYWFFFPYNRGKRVCIGYFADNMCPPGCPMIAGNCLCPRIRGCIGGYSTFGHHVGDWEHTIMRFKNGKPYSVYLSIHDTDITKEFGGEFLWDGRVFRKGGKVLKMDGTHPVVYAADGSHGIWPDAGRHEYKTLPNNAKLVDFTSEGGQAWNTWNNVKITTYRPDQRYTGPSKWLEFNGKWGNLHDGCGIAKKVSGECQLNTGPGGPQRSFMKEGKLG